MASAFSKIIAGEIPCAKIWEDDEFLAFLDINPIQPGHTLLIPKYETDYIFDLDESSYAKLMSASRKVALALQNAIKCNRVCVVVAGYGVPHVHVHLIPTNRFEDFPSPPTLKMTAVELQSKAAEIRSAFRLRE